MNGARDGLGKVADLMKTINDRPIPAVSANASTASIVDSFAGRRHSRIVYVLDEEDRLCGVISLGSLVRHVFFHYHDDSMDMPGIISMAIAETARDFMRRDPLSTTPSEGLEQVLERMIAHNIKEIAVLDERGRVLADLTLVDILERYQSVTSMSGG